VSCNQVRRELLAHIAFADELGPRSGPYLAHLDACAECREEIGFDRALVRHLRTALLERVDGRAPSAASWEMVRRRTVETPVRPWAARVLRLGGMASAAIAGIMIFAIGTPAETPLLSAPPSPLLTAAMARRAVLSADLNAGPPPTSSRSEPAEEELLPPKQGWPTKPDTGIQVAWNDNDMPPVPGRRR
jgi:hypothetical protein